MIFTQDLGDFVRYNHPDLVRFLASRGYRDPDAVHDITQDAYLSMAQYNSLESYDPRRGPFPSYVFTILNRALSKYVTAEALQTHGEALENPDQAGACYQDVVSRIKAFQAYVQRSGAPKLSEIQRQIRNRVEGRAWSGLCIRQFNRIRARFLASE
jgi:Sigma-70 region 2.